MATKTAQHTRTQDRIVFQRLGKMTGGELFRRPSHETVAFLLGGLRLSEGDKDRLRFELGGIIRQLQHKIDQRAASEMQYRDCL
jgi:hypothetical protein